ncbi:MAG: ABC transporter permease [Lachnospiraceae bacterium]|nr:ABC transporter permease [Lachnospiraceae bacterium]
MKKLLELELKRNNLIPYHIATVVSTVVMLGFICLLAFIPRIESDGADAALFTSLTFISGLTIIVMTGIFTILSSVIASRMIVEEYSGKRSALVFSYPIPRSRIFIAKLVVVFGYTFLAMFVCGGVTIMLFSVSDLIFRFTAELPDGSFLIHSLFRLMLFSLMSVCFGMISLWFGFIRRSVIWTIISSCVIISVVCQIVAVSLFSDSTMYVMVLIAVLIAAATYSRLQKKVQHMEVA